MCVCGASAIARCRDCFATPVRCPVCIVKDHGHQPFHWVDVWQGQYLEKTELSALGLICFLGHRGLPCPLIPSTRQPSNLVVTHTNGVHRARVHWCHCADGPPSLSQLLRAGLFPATLEHPESAFTLHLLKEWDIHFLTSKKSAYDYMEAVRRLTDNAAPHRVKVCSFRIIHLSTHELNRIAIVNST